MDPIIGNDVIGLPGQNLNLTELKVLVGLADGETPTQIARSIDTDTIGLRYIERNIQGKLNGKTKTHIITRGFVTGVLITRALCLLLVFCMTVGNNSDVTRTRTRTRTRTSRTVRVRTRSSGIC